MAAKLTIQVVGWNSAAVLPDTIKAFLTIPRDEVVFRYIDNASTDASVDLVQQQLPQADIIRLPSNNGFAGAHNIAFARCTTPLVMTCDPDVALDWHGVRALITAFADERVAAVQGKLYRAEEKIIDSAGIRLTRALNGQERGAFERDEGQYDGEEELIAVTGAAGIFRVSALHSVAETTGAIFDEDFFAYKEDVDLGWRLNRAGWRVLYRPILMGRHRRTLGRRGFLNWGLSLTSIHERLMSDRTRYSLRNWVWMILKNASLKQEMLAEVFVDARLLFFFVMSVVYPPLFPVWFEIVRGIPGMLAKRDTVV